ncbi:MAG: WYL domain-containing transcriptional regulator [Proteobacteria bacterium]|nr:WYL domain-containing transcriptional regulator [Pseudomonadota bacterium]
MIRRGGVTAEELKERFELDARTLRRYYADLREINIPLRDDGVGEERVISLDPDWRRTGVQLSLAEVLSLHFGRTLFNFLEGTSFASDLEGAIERLEPAISRTHRDLCRQLDTKFLAVAEQAKDYRGITSEIVDESITALVYNCPLDARYRKANGVERTYQLHPYSLATFRQGLYLFAKDVRANQVKTYALERFTELARRRREHFEVPIGWRPDAHIAHAFGIISGPPQEVVVAFTNAVSAYIRERTWHPTQVHRTMPDGRLELRMQVAVTVELRTWIQGFGPDARVLGPDFLVAEIKDALCRAAKQYS